MKCEICGMNFTSPHSLWSHSIKKHKIGQGKNPVEKPGVKEKVSKTWFKKGKHYSPKTEFKKGDTPWWIRKGVAHPLNEPEVYQKASSTFFHPSQIPWNKGVPMREITKLRLSKSKKGSKSWNKGLTAFSDSRVRKCVEGRGSVFKNTSIELKVQNELQKRRYSFETHMSMFGYPDIVIQDLAIFIDGCYWHGCPLCGHYNPDQQEYDKKISRLLVGHGYKVLRIWGHEVNGDIKRCVDRIEQTLGVV